jgi:hypothetical protein
VLIFVALRLPSKRRQRGLAPPWPWLLGLIGAVWSILWFGLVVLAFGIDPAFPTAAAGAGGLTIAALLLIFVPRWAAHPRWSRAHEFALIAGSLTGSMVVSFAGFIGSVNMDLWFKVVVDALAVVGLVWLGRRVRGRNKAVV